MLALALFAVMGFRRHLGCTSVAEAVSTPALDVIASFRFLHIHLALGAPLPAFLAGEPPEQEVLPAALVLPELLELPALDVDVPRHRTAGAEEPVAVRALRLHDGGFAICEKRRRAFLVRAVHLLGTQSGLAQQQFPFADEVRGDDAAAALWLDHARAAAARVRTLHESEVLDQLRGDVLGDAAGAEGVAARADTELEGARHRLHADGAVELAVSPEQYAVWIGIGCELKTNTSPCGSRNEVILELNL